MNIKNKIKSIMVLAGWTMSDIIKELNVKYNRKDTVQNLSNKLTHGTLRYKEAIEIAEVIGYKIEWIKNSAAFHKGSEGA